MSERIGFRRLRLLIGAVGISVLLGGTAVAADAPANPPPSQNAVINLIRLLVKQGVISQQQADSLVKEAEAEAAQAKQTAAAQTAATTPPPPEPGTLRVPYVPEIVKKQIADSVRAQVLEEARNENWAQPEAIPEWTKHVKVTGDLRARSQSDFYSASNVGPCTSPALPACANDGYVDFASFNDLGPIDINEVTNPTGFPFLNTRVNRPFRESIRARLNVAVDVTPGVMFDVRIASGQNNSPVSTAQLFGGGWGKKDIWLDQAYIRLSSDPWANLTMGRMPNPFLHTDLVYDDDLNFDGVAVSASSKPADKRGFGVSGTAGFFPLEYGGANFPTYAAGKTHDFYKWMQGGQLVADWKGRDWDWKFGVGYYDFVNVRGQLSSPCALYNGNKQCDTDQSRPAFMQKGNTLFLLRAIIPDPANPTNYAQPQFVGLSFDYNVLNATTQLDFNVGDTYHLTLDADYARNLAFSPASAYRNVPLGIPLNNLHANAPVLTVPAALQSGPNGMQGKIAFGYQKPSEAWEWNVWGGYRYLEPDAVLDAFTDSDFHLGGTNAKGYFIGGTLGLFHNTSITARWMSGNEVFGPPLAIDVFQLDLNTGF